MIHCSMVSMITVLSSSQMTGLYLSLGQLPDQGGILTSVVVLYTSFVAVTVYSVSLWVPAPSIEEEGWHPDFVGLIIKGRCPHLNFQGFEEKLEPSWDTGECTEADIIK